MLTDGNYHYRDEHLVMYVIVKLLCGTPEINIILYIQLKIHVHVLGLD